MPTSVFILRFRLVTFYKDLFDSKQDVLSNALEFRLKRKFSKIIMINGKT